MQTIQEAKEKVIKNQKAWNIERSTVTHIQIILNGILTLSQKDTSIYKNTVLWVENRLSQAKCLAPDQVNGIWGDSTTVALKLYQGFFGLKQDGIIGKDTMVALIQNEKVYKFLNFDLSKESIKLLTNLYKKYGYKIRDDINLCGLEGYINNTKVKNIVDEWNDSLIIWSPAGFIKAYIGSVNPGRYYVNNPLNPYGCANLCAGQYSAWQVGIHNNNHEALIQTAGTVKVWRDYNKNFSYDKGIDKVEEGNFGINIHWGYDGYTVGRASAGCQVIQKWSDQQEYMYHCKTMNKDKQGIFTYALFTQEQY